MKGLFRVVVMAMTLSMLGGFAVPTTPVVAAQEDATQPVGMVSGAWRMMAWQFAFAPAFPEQGLEARDGSNWGILVADMTNTGVDAGLSVTEMQLGDSDVTGDVEQSVAVSQALGFTGLGADGVLSVAENGIARVAVVMDIPEGVGNPAIRIGDEVVSVESVMTDTLELGGIPEATTEMQLEIGSVLAIFSASEYELAMDSGEFRQLAIQGLVPPMGSSCHAESSKMFVTDLPKDVWVETLPGLETPTLWQHDADNGVFALMDQVLVEAGMVEVIASSSEEASAYTGWLAPKVKEAQANALGMFGDCSDETAPSPTPTSAPVESAPASDSSVNGGLSAMLSIFNNPYAYMGETVVVSGYVMSTDYSDEGVSITVIMDEVNGQLVMFGAGQVGIQPLPSVGDYVVVTGVVIEVVNTVGPNGSPISAPVILASSIN